MSPEEAVDAVARAQLEHINGDLIEIKTDLKEQRILTGQTREDVAGIKTEIRLLGGIILTLLLALMGILLNHLAQVGTIP